MTLYGSEWLCMIIHNHKLYFSIDIVFNKILKQFTRFSKKNIWNVNTSKDLLTKSRFCIKLRNSCSICACSSRSGSFWKHLHAYIRKWLKSWTHGQSWVAIFWFFLRPLGYIPKRIIFLWSILISMYRKDAIPFCFAVCFAVIGNTIIVIQFDPYPPWMIGLTTRIHKHP